MDKLIDYVCDELKELEKKADKGGLSASEIQYADTLAHLKKNLLKGEEMYEEMEGGYSGAMRGGMSYRDGMDGMSYARKRDSMGRYSSDYDRRGGRYSYAEGREAVKEHLEMAMREATDDKTRREIQRMIDGMMM